MNPVIATTCSSFSSLLSSSWLLYVQSEVAS